MKFDVAVRETRTTTDLRRIAGAHVIDHRQLSDDELQDAVIKMKPQYLHEETVEANLHFALFKTSRNDVRIMSRVLLIDVLLDQYDFLLPVPETEELTIAFEQSIVNRSNETELIDLACGDGSSHRFRDLDLYNYVLATAWENEDTKSPDEVNLLRKLDEVVQ